MCAQVTDTLRAVKLFSKKPVNITASPVTVQELNKEMLSKLNSISVADAVKYFSGVVVKDYGGIGGLKTISVRSLGANHTGLMYDGIMIGDAQGGQIDLGRFSLDNIETIQLYNEQPVDILLPARSFASASVLALSSSSAENNGDKNEITLKLKTGSFGFINPTVSFKRRFNKHFRHAISGEYQSADGAYTFIDYETGAAKSKRTNSDIKTYRLEYGADYSITDSNAIRLKAYYYNSKRGLPGSVILYNSFSNQRLNNESFFTQLSWQKNLSSKSRILISSKYSTDKKYYIDPSYPNSAGKLENEFHQQEFYCSVAYGYKIKSNLSLSYAADYYNNKLKRTDQFARGFANPERDHFLNHLSLQLKKKYFEINGYILLTTVHEKVENGRAAKQFNELSPGISASLQPFAGLPLRVRASFKNIFRAPTFDDLYYTNIGNVDLLPEYVKQYNLGITINTQADHFLKEIIFTADGYYNMVKDKIIAVPRQNLFQWTMLNIGKADIKGLDIAAHFNFIQWKGLIVSSNLSYSFQQALNVSDPASTNYKTQLPYTPQHSGSVNLNINYRKLSFSYNVLSSSYRYQLGNPGPENVVQGWATHDFSVNYLVASKKYWNYKFVTQLNNVFNTQYEIIKFYPMPGFNYRIGIITTFKK